MYVVVNVNRGYGIGPMLWGPMSEIPQVGFNLLYIPTLLIFVVFQVPTGLSVNLGMLLVFRFLSGFFGSPVLANGGASIAYMFSAQKRAYPIVVWGATAVCGPVLGRSFRSTSKIFPFDPLQSYLTVRYIRSRCRRVRCTGKGLEVDDLGAFVALRIHSHRHLLLPPRNKSRQHPLPPHTPPPQAHRAPQSSL